jgi:hypothetical protein
MNDGREMWFSMRTTRRAGDPEWDDYIRFVCPPPRLRSAAAFLRRRVPPPPRLTAAVSRRRRSTPPHRAAASGRRRVALKCPKQPLQLWWLLTSR